MKWQKLEHKKKIPLNSNKMLEAERYDKILTKLLKLELISETNIILTQVIHYPRLTGVGRMIPFIPWSGFPLTTNLLYVF